MTLRIIVFLLCTVDLLALPAGAATKHQIDQAIARGVSFLKESQKADGTWNYPASGATALAGLALLESGQVKGTDPVVQKAAAYLRDHNHETQTYSLALMIFFFDRLGNPRDAQLLSELGERLRDGQTESGAWTYSCMNRGTARRGNSAPKGRPPIDLGGIGGVAGIASGDNSNTQFALMGLWVARRHAVEVTEALAKTDAYFRTSQCDDGGWRYAGGPGGGSTGSMTCAGLLGLLVHQGSQAMLRGGTAADLKGKARGTSRRLAAIMEDSAVKKAMERLEQFLRPESARGIAPRNGLRSELYFWWSVERVGAAYGLKQIGHVDWYVEGANAIVALQQANGSWTDTAPPVGTSFALLFLKRANLARDLTGLITGQQSGESSLRSGSVDDLPRVAKDGSKAKTPLATERASADDLSRATPEELVAALGDVDQDRRNAILQELHGRKGVEATLALSAAIGQVEGDARAMARNLLVKRLGRMTSSTLGKYLESGDAEIQKAAAEAIVAKHEPSLTGKLIELLSRPNVEVANAAHAALIKLTGQQFGPFEGAKTADRFVIIKRWKGWWEKQPAASDAK